MTDQHHFIHEVEYYNKRDALNTALAQLSPDTTPQASDTTQAALNAYHDFISLRDQALPLLLACSADQDKPSTSVQLPRAPSHLFLLPPLNNAAEPERYLVCLFPTTTSYPAEIQLIRWHVTVIEDQASQVRTDHLTFDHRLNSDCTLDAAPLDITIYDQDETEQIFRLTFRTGRLTVTLTDLDTSQPELHTAWNTRSISRPIQQQRSTYGRMPTILRADVNLKTDTNTGLQNWPDQTLLAQNHTALTLSSSDTLISQMTGQVKGADAALNDQGKPGPAYLASNLSHLICLQAKDNGHQLHHSKLPLGGYVEDVLVMADPAQPADHIILAPCHDGNLYLFNSLSHENSLQIRHWQVAKAAKISRVMGRVDGHLLALDQYQQLIALRLHDPETFIQLRNTATEQLFHHLWGAPEKRKNWLSQLTIDSVQTPPTIQALRLLTEAWLYVQQYPQNIPDWDNTFIQNTWQQLTELFKPVHHTQTESMVTLAYVYHQLTQRVWQWMAGNCHAVHLQQQVRTKHQRSADFITQASTLLQLPDAAPDWLWLQHFRAYDWLPLWQAAIKEQGNKGIQQLSKTLQQQIQCKRKQFAPQAYANRGLVAKSSVRLPDPVRHLRSLGDGVVLGVMQARQLVTICNEQGHYQELNWEEKTSTKPYPWFGQIRSLCLLSPDVQSTEQQVLISTNRGECYLILIQHHTYQVQAVQTIELDCASARYFAFDGTEQRSGFMLAGNNPAGHAALHWLELKSGPQLHPYSIWQSNAPGRLRAIMPDRQDRWLFGVDELNGDLLCWPLDPIRSRKPKNTALTAHTWHSANGPRYIIDIAQQPDASCEQIVCSGQNGIVNSFGLSPNQQADQPGPLLWQFDCGHPVRRIRRICLADHTGVWLLAGDADYATLVDDQGRMTQLIEQVGPVSAVTVLQPDQLVAIGAESGRILFLSWDIPEASTHSSTKPPDYPALYPLRINQPAPASSVRELIKAANDNQPAWQHALCTETLVLQSISQACYQELVTAQHLDELTQRLSAIFIHPLSLPQAALILQRAQQLDDGTSDWLKQSTTSLVALLDTIWQQLQQQCYIARDPLNGLLNVIATLAELIALRPGQSTTTHRGQALVAQISDTIWRTADNTPAWLAARHCHYACMTQASRAWQRLGSDVQVSDWVRNLALIWGRPPAEICWQRLHTLVTTGFPVTDAPHQPWLNLFRKTADPTQITPDQLIAIGLGDLRQPPEHDQLNEATWARLDTLFGTNIWSDWLAALESALDQLRRTRQGVHYASLEGEYLDNLEFHLTERAAKAFQIGTKLTLAGLIWPAIQHQWQQVIEQRHTRLLELSQDATDRHHIDVQAQVIRQDNHHIRFTLNLTNRNIKPVRITEIQATKYTLAQTRLNISLAPHQHPHEYQSIDGQLQVDNTVPGHLTETLYLNCTDSLDRPFDYTIQLDDTCTLAAFRPDADWQASYQRLKTLLDSGKPFARLKGPFWPAAEHERLWRQIVAEYPQAASSMQTIDLDKLEDWPAELPLYVPDWSDTHDATDDIRQIHQILHHRSRFNAHPIALCLWLAVNPPPANMQRILHQHNTFIQDVYTQFSQLTPQAKQGLPALQGQCLPVWCSSDSLTCPTEPNGGLLGFTSWSVITTANLQPSELATWFDIPESHVKHCLSAWQLLDTLQQASAKKQLSILQQMLARLFKTPPQARSTYVDQPINLLHRTYNGVYLLASAIAVPTDLAADALCLCYDCQLPAALENDALTLDTDQLLTLLSCATVDMRRHRLNQIAVIQLKLYPEKIFQSSAGLPEQYLERLFYGRERLTLVDKLTQLAKSAATDKAEGTYLVVASGRRIGKTTLIQMLKQRVSQLPDQPLILDINGLKITSNSTNGLLQAFLQRAKNEFAKYGETIRYTWTQEDNPSQRDEAKRQFEQRLEDVRPRHGCPVFLFDETHHLVEQDAQGEEPYALFRYLRGLIGTNKMILIATTVPFRSKKSATLWEMRHDSATPFYNTGEAVFLTPWQPDETWNFIHDQLFSFGITVPSELRLDILALCRGFAWIAQRLCQLICDKMRENRHANLASGLWLDIRQNIMQEVRKTLWHQVNDAAGQNDTTWKVDAENMQKASLTQDDRFWQALLTQARQAGCLSLPPDINTAWPEESGFTLEQLYQTLHQQFSRERLRDTLSRLTGTSVLIQGTATEADRYTFHGDLIHHCL